MFIEAEESSLSNILIKAQSNPRTVDVDKVISYAI
jgi:hypothetical protein